jgi:hypothetical protein
MRRSAYRKAGFKPPDMYSQDRFLKRI